MRVGIATWFAAALVVCTVQARAAETADETYVAALRRLREADFEGSLALLERARKMAVEPALLALILRQEGVIYLALGRKEDGLTAFVSAVRADRALGYGDVVAGDEARAIFECARGFAAGPMSEAEIGGAVSGEFDPKTWACPAAPPIEVKQAARATPDIAAAPAEPLAGEPPAAAPEPPPGPPEIVAPAPPFVVPAWPIWLAAGVSVAAGATGTVFGLSAISNAKTEATTRDPAEFTTAGKAADDNATLATASFVVAGAAAASALALLVWRLAGDEPAGEGPASPSTEAAPAAAGAFGF